MKWNLRVQAAERGIWKSAELRRMLADAGWEIASARCQVVDALRTGGWTSRRHHLILIAHRPTAVPEPEKIAARKPGRAAGSQRNSNIVTPRFGPKHDRPRVIARHANGPLVRRCPAQAAG